MWKDGSSTYVPQLQICILYRTVSNCVVRKQIEIFSKHSKGQGSQKLADKENASPAYVLFSAWFTQTDSAFRNVEMQTRKPNQLKSQKRKSRKKSNPSSARSLPRSLFSLCWMETAPSTCLSMRMLTRRCPSNGAIAMPRRSRTQKKSSCGASVRITTALGRWSAIGWQIDCPCHDQIRRSALCVGVRKGILLRWMSSYSFVCLFIMNDYAGYQGNSFILGNKSLFPLPPSQQTNCSTTSSNPAFTKTPSSIPRHQPRLLLFPAKSTPTPYKSRLQSPIPFSISPETRVETGVTSCGGLIPITATFWVAGAADEAEGFV